MSAAVLERVAEPVVVEVHGDLLCEAVLVGCEACCGSVCLDHEVDLVGCEGAWWHRGCHREHCRDATCWE